MWTIVWFCGFDMSGWEMIGTYGSKRYMAGWGYYVFWTKKKDIDIMAKPLWSGSGTGFCSR
jgi:hypothetical protein